MGYGVWEEGGERGGALQGNEGGEKEEGRRREGSVSLYSLLLFSGRVLKGISMTKGRGGEGGRKEALY